MLELNQHQKRERKRLRKLTQSLLRLLGLIGMVLFIRALLNKQAHIHEGIRAFNKYLLNPVVVNIAGRRYGPYTVLYHIGRHSGKAYATPIVAQPTKPCFVIPLPYGEKVDWLRNIEGTGNCTIEWKDGTYLVEKPEVLDATTALPLFSPARRWIYEKLGIHQFLQVSFPTAVPEAVAVGS